MTRTTCVFNLGQVAKTFAVADEVALQFGHLQLGISGICWGYIGIMENGNYYLGLRVKGI